MFFILFFLFPRQIFAEDFVIDTFHSDIVIEKSGIVEIKETIVVDFGSNQKHGIYRDIPYVYATGGSKTYTEIDIREVKRDGDLENYEIERNDANLRVKIGNANKTISGEQKYEINYTNKGILRRFDGYDEIYWDVTGNNWLTDISSVSATVSLPEPTITKVNCFEGYTNSENECTSEIIGNNTARFSTTLPLGSSQGMTIVANYTKGMTPILSVAAPEKYPFLKLRYLYVFLVTASIGIFLVLYHWYRQGRDIWSPVPLSLSKDKQGKSKPLFSRDTIVVEFEPPENLRPAEIGVLVDQRADTLDITSTIIDLAERGYVKIKEIEKSWVFGKRDYELTKTKKDFLLLLSYEQELIMHLFETSNTILVSELKMKFYDDLKKVKEKLYETVVKKGFFVENPEKRRNNFLGIAVVLSVTSFIILLNLLAHYYIISFLGGVIVSSIFLLIFSRSMPRRTVVGSDLYRRALGYRLFISGAEKYRQQFFEKKNMLNEILPYTIVFGLTDKFAKAMEKMGIEQKNPTWYTGSHFFTYSAFASNMNSFSSSLSTAMSSAPSSSGSSGGSSGGGFGGGGGGSW